MPEAGGWQLKWGRHGKYISGHKANIFQETQKRHFCLLYIHNSHPSHFYIENQHTMCGSLRGDTSVMMIMSVNDSTPSFCRRNKGKTREEWRELIWVDYTNSNRGMVDIISRPGGLTTAQPEQLPVHAKKKYNSLEVFPRKCVRHCTLHSLFISICTAGHPSKVDVWVSLFVESYQGDGQLVRLADWRRQSAMIITRVQSFASNVILALPGDAEEVILCTRFGKLKGTAWFTLFVAPHSPDSYIVEGLKGVTNRANQVIKKLHLYF